MSTEGGLGKMMAEMMKKEVSGARKEGDVTQPLMPRVGDKIRLAKRQVQEGMSSVVPSGDVIEGELVQEVRLGEQLLHTKGQTSAIQAMRIEGDKIVLETQTSIYELTRV